MELEEARAFMGELHRGILSTVRGDGRPQMSAVSVALDAQGRPSISTRESAFKVRNIRKDARVSLCVMSDDFSSWIQVDGTATIVPLPEAMDELVSHYRALAGEHPDWGEYRQAMVDQARVIVLIDIERAGPDRHA